jgi:hypothetical protein
VKEEWGQEEDAPQFTLEESTPEAAPGAALPIVVAARLVPVFKPDRLEIAFSLLEELEGGYIGAHPEVAARGTTLHMVATGVSAELCDGAEVAAMLEACAVRRAAARGYRNAFSVCTNAVSEVIAAEAGFEERASIVFDGWEAKDGAAPLRGRVEPPHTRAVLMARELATCSAA